MFFSQFFAERKALRLERIWPKQHLRLFKNFINKISEQQKAYIRAKFSGDETDKVYGKRNINVEIVFECLKAILDYSRFSFRGKEREEND